MGEGRGFLRRPRPRIARAGPGRFRLHLPEEERALIRQLLPSLREAVASGDPSARRLFPTAYHDDPEKEREYQGLMHDELVASRYAAVDAVERTLDEREIGMAALERWMEAINSIRLVIGTRLDVGEEPYEPDPSDPEAPAYEVYHYLGFLLELAVQAMTEELADPARPAV
ncbi:MAG: DUF2017 family protein [Actinomycetota bacterium]